MAKGNRWTEEQKQWLRDNYEQYKTYDELLKGFNSTFNLNITKNAMYIMMTVKLDIRVTNLTAFTKEQEDWLISNIGKVDGYEQLTNRFNSRFKTDRKATSISDKCTKSLGIGLAGNKISNKGQFRKGNIRPQLPIGTIRKNSNGVTYVKMQDSLHSYQKGYKEPYWMPIQKKIWIDHGNEVKDGEMVVFLDGNRENLDISNLYCIDRRISAILSSNRWWSTDPVVTLTAIKWCELYYAMSK